MIQNVLILCIGNICRSPMASALFLEKFNDLSLPISIHSAGLSALIGQDAHPFSQELMRSKGLDISSHKACQVSTQIINAADIVFTMDTQQQVQVEERYPDISGRVYRLGKWGEYNIPDPYLRPKIAFEHSLLLIEQGVNEWCSKLWIEKNVNISDFMR